MTRTSDLVWRRALLVDDIRSFTADELGVESVVVAKSSKEAIRALSESTTAFDVVFLDFDLSSGNEDRHDTGDAVVDYLRDNAEGFASRISVVTVTDLDKRGYAMASALVASGFKATVSRLGHEWNDRNLERERA